MKKIKPEKWIETWLNMYYQGFIDTTFFNVLEKLEKQLQKTNEYKEWIKTTNKITKIMGELK